MLKEFKDWIMSGNLIEIAVGLILALKFGDLVTSFTEKMVTPIIGMIGGKDFSTLNFKINGATFGYGDVINKAISFVLAGAVLFLIVKAALRFMKSKPAPPPPTYAVEKYDEAALNARAADGWEVVSAGEAGVVLKK